MVFQSRISGSDLFHHIYARGNDRHPIFKEEKHYNKYLFLLQKHSNLSRIEIIAYALMQTHVHLFVHDLYNTVSNFMLHLHGSYARYYNLVTGRLGHVFGERFNNKIVQPNNYALTLSRYIHRQAVAAGLVKDPYDYPWTSYRIYTGKQVNHFLKTNIILEQFGKGADHFRMYEKFVCDHVFEPIDWLDTKQLIIGDDDYKDKIRLEITGFTEEMIYKASIQEVVEKIIGADRRKWISPRGKSERSLRHKAIIILGKDYLYSESEIARVFEISAAAVSKVLNKS